MKKREKGLSESGGVDERGDEMGGNLLGFEARGTGSNQTPPFTDCVVCVNSLTFLSCFFSSFTKLRKRLL